jgi:Sigma-70 region 2
VGVKMRLLAKDPWAPPQTDLSTPTGCLTKPYLPDNAEHKPPCDPFSRVLTPGQSDLLTAEQERVMIKHLPILQFIARRIHVRLPQDMPIEDLYSAGVIGLLDAFGRFDPALQIKFRRYAQFRIRGAILDSLRTLDWSPRDRLARRTRYCCVLLAHVAHRSMKSSDPERSTSRALVRRKAGALATCGKLRSYLNLF